MVRKPKLLSSIRAKLFSAVAMLLVAVIMVVSSTYAWFTLSTAPEVTGMTTAIGANGSLEMALMPAEGLTTGTISSSAGDSLKDATEKNLTWGNLVDLTSAVYGLDKIALMPSELNMTNGVLAASILKTPEYGADGRVGNLKENTSFGTFSTGNSNFIPNDLFGVRGVGVASGLTPRQLAHRNALSAAATAKVQALTAATQSLNTNGAALADIAIKHGANSEATHTQAEVGNLLEIVDDLLGTDSTTGVLQYIERAYMNYILVYVAGANTPGEEGKVTYTYSAEVVNAVSNAIAAPDASIATVLTALKVDLDNLPAPIKNPITALQSTIATVEDAQTGLNGLTGDDIAWTDLYAQMSKLAKTNSMTVCGYPIDKVKENAGEIASQLGSTGIVVEMTTGGGVYADIADHCGNYNASITIEKIEASGISMTNMDANMKITTTINPVHLGAVETAMKTAAPTPAGESDVVMPMTEFYGYVIDLAFRTNAAESNLLLQTDAVDRIYENNTNTETEGHGSSMTFKATTNGFSDDQVKGLMSCIRIIFFDPTGSGSGTFLAEAHLDTSKATLSTEGWTAPMFLYEDMVKTVYRTTDVAEGETLGTVKYTEYEGKFYNGDVDVKNLSGVEALLETPDDLDTLTPEKLTVGEKQLAASDAVITSLTQNTATPVSALVYLDGANLTNADVAATAATSVTGKMNLQFASSATLVPMENGELHQKAEVGTLNVTASATDASVATTNAASYDFKGSQPTGWDVGADGKVTVPSTAVAGDSVTIRAKDSNGKVLKIWTVTVVESGT